MSRSSSTGSSRPRSSPGTPTHGMSSTSASSRPSPGDAAERAAGEARRPVDRRATHAPAGLGDRPRVLGRCCRVSQQRRRPVSDPVDVPTGEALDRLRGRDVVYQREKSAFDHDREFLFKHALLRDVAYEGMFRRHRRTYHRLAASWFEQMAETSRGPTSTPA